MHSDVPLYLDPFASIEDRVEDLLSRMTLDEKMWQLMQGDIENNIDVNYNLNVSTLQPYGTMFGKSTSKAHYPVLLSDPAPTSRQYPTRAFGSVD